ncbi:MAG: hypothetical protein MJA83_01810, partial [Gammaproteobacteria bacterium]|nr:hypothetical protein [Gammaproteobacteria bacterium]
MADVLAFKGTFTTPATTGPDAVTGVGFTPKAILLWGVPATDEAVNADACHWFGMTDGTNDKTVSMSSEDAAINGRRDLDESNCLSILDTPSDTPVAVASLASFDADGFTLNYSSTTANLVVHFVAIGGEDCQAVVGQEPANSSPVNGLPFQPQFVFAMTSGQVLGSAQTDHTIQSFGCFDDSLNEWWVAADHEFTANTNKDSIVRSSGFIGQLFDGSITWEASVSTINADGWSWTGSNADGFYYLALHLGDAGSVAGTFTKSTGTAPADQDLP